MKVVKFEDWIGGWPLAIGLWRLDKFTYRLPLTTPQPPQP